VSEAYDSGAGHLFISYSRSDRTYVEQLATHLKRAGIDVWFDHQIAAGERWSLAIEHQIATCDAVIIVMTLAARASTMVENEIDFALSRHKPRR